MEKQPHAKFCGAKTRSGVPCKNRPMTNGRCRMHGGKSTGPPKGNKNAVKTGEYETIWLDTLDDDERVFFDSIPLNVMVQIDNEIRLLEIRERRMMKRVKDVMDGWEEDEVETKYELKSRKEKVPVYSEDGEVRYELVTRHEMVETERTEKKREKLARIIAIEEALTRVQDKKMRLIELKQKILTQHDKDAGGKGLLDELAEVIRQSAEMLGDDDAT